MEHEPCKNCSKKGCGSYHDICEKYQKAKAYQDEKNAEIKKQREINIALDLRKRKRYGRNFSVGQR